MLSGVRMAAPLRIRDFRLLWSGLTVSLVGDGVFYVALAWQVYELSNAPTALSVVGVAMTVPQVAFLLLGGVLSDRMDRRRIMLAADVTRGVAVGAIGLLSLSGHLKLWHVAVLAAVYGAGAAFFGPAFDAIVPDIVPADLLGEANALEQFVRPIALRMGGPALGGALIAVWGSGGAFLVDAGSFLVSAAFLLAVRGRGAPARADSEPPPSAVREIREGYTYVRSHVWLWGTFVAASFAYLLFMGPTEVLLPFVVRNDLGGSAGDLGMVFAVGGIGAVAASLVMGQRGQPRRHMTFVYTTWAVATFAVAGYGLATLPWHLMAACFVFNALESAGTIVWSTTKHRLVPPALLGRVSSYDWFVSIGLLPVSFALTGPAAALLGARGALVAAGVLGGVVTIGFLFLPGMRAIERDQAPAPAPLDAEAPVAALIP
ncbi:MAG: MFS transporter [Euzebyaceae bacterium]|jgi:DHA3 family tetracycline resistance protein-like MFS transporter|nr:MFS transporter [Euzebyaceae bacterium]